MSHAFERRWITSLPLEECRTRVARENEEATIWATKYQQRTVVKVWQVDHNLAGFELKRVPKSSMSFGFGNGITALGILQRTPDGTEVFVQAKISPLVSIMLPLVTLFFWGALSTIARSLLIAQPLVLTVLASGGILIALVIYMFYWMDSERRRLLRIVEASLDL